MKQHPALGILEFADIAAGIDATDAILKRAPIAFLRAGTITAGRFLAVFGGTTASVAESYDEGLRRAAGFVADSVFLPDVHPRVHEAVQGLPRGAGGRSLAVIETTTVSATVRGAEAALKGTPVDLVVLRLGDSGLAGKGLAVYDGHLPDLEAAVQLATGTLACPGGGVSCRIIAAPHEALIAAVRHDTAFAAALVVQLEGERL
jgi:microcompartment protein CcmL/EutN